MAKWNNTATTENQHVGNSERKRDARTSENISQISEILSDADGQKSVGRLSSITGIKPMSVHNIP